MKRVKEKRDRQSHDGKALRQQKNCQDGWRQVVSSLFIANASVFIEVCLLSSYFYLRNAVFLSTSYN
jgi:hypothetical protein